MIEKTIYITQLFDRYQGLLTKKQQEMLTLYYEADLSLAEIADYYEISRQAVYDNVKRATQALIDYELILQLNEKQTQIDGVIDQLVKVANGNQELLKLITQLKEINE